MNDHDMKLAIAHAMKQYGGSFVKALGDCVIYADDSNLSKLQKAFPEEFEKYSEIARQEMLLAKPLGAEPP